jgi:soluble P-type ATPase
MMTRSNIANAINAAQAGAEAAKRKGARYAAECGRLLAQAKETIPRLKNVPASDIVIAMGDVQEDRKRRAAEVRL